MQIFKPFYSFALNLTGITKRNNIFRQIVPHYTFSTYNRKLSNIHATGDINIPSYENTVTYHYRFRYTFKIS